MDKKQLGIENTIFTGGSDFGFTAVDEADIAQPLNDKLTQMRTLIQPLLENLMANPSKDIIQWKGALREQQIKDFIVKLDAICPLPSK